MNSIGPGTRLLCLQIASFEHSIEVGKIYTCDEVRPIGTSFVICAIHGPGCHHDGVRLAEFSGQYRSNTWHCLGAFKPIDGDLPASLTRFLDEPFIKTKELEPA